MRCRNEIVIDADRETVWCSFEDRGKTGLWQPTLQSFTCKSGTPGEPGQVAELVYLENGREVVMTETLTEKRRPDFTAATYESSFGHATVVNHFAAIDARRTRWTIYSNYRFKGIMRVMSLLFRKSINARLDDRMQRFKLLVETEVAGRS